MLTYWVSATYANTVNRSTVESDHLEISAQTGESKFWGNVVFESPQYLLYSGYLLVKSQKDDGDRWQVKELHAWDEVRLLYEDKRGFSDELFYYHDEQIIELVGNARLVDNTGSMEAPLITIYEPTGEVVVKGDEHQRIRVIFED
ncbi:lipopolysaccharide transport protein LptA [Desulfurispira natronophila]|uniref:Lipopolysaccharide transport protein LptA n=1 Tax=Desulfurispira natronophila TaxID=682562 RepID=A0A7W8DG54_9BACT|nr:lipopolysaccharide transport protein LptA [Desulfurispira natronophila]